MPIDTFLNQTNCDRCGGGLKIRTMSWFTEETICSECSDKEAEIKKKLREKGIQNAMEGCGYIPDLEML